jgi:hypothetical protein
MYQLTHRAALRMERSLPSGTPTLAGWNMRHRVIDSNQLGLPSHCSSHRQVLWEDLTLPQPIMGAEPITISANLWQGSHYSNHGGK